MIYLLLVNSLLCISLGYALKPPLKLEPLPSGSRTEADKSSYEDIFKSIRFGYENSQSLEREARGKSEQLRKRSYTSSALCYPQIVRPRGCEPLFNAEVINQDLFSDPRFKQLPCVTDGSCPYAQFRCSRGHVWKAVPGSPVCFHCPVCKAPRKVYSRRRKPSPTRDQLLQSLQDFVTESKGTLLSVNFDEKDKWGSSVVIQCEEGHQWTSNLRNTLANKSWCLTCAINKTKLTEQEMHYTAAQFGGRFLGYIDENNNNETNEEDEESEGEMRLEAKKSSRIHGSGSSVKSLNRKALWMCARGHEFVQYPGNIRRAPGGRRKCSWCRQCKKDGLKFVWTPTKQQDSA